MSRYLTDQQWNALSALERRLQSALRQERRLQEAYRQQQIRLAELNPPPEWSPPPDIVALDDQVDDEVYYLLLMAHRALRTTRDRATSCGISLPRAKSALTLEKLRNVYEHWDEDRPPAGTAFHESLRWWARKKSGKYLAKTLHPKAWPQSYSGTPAELEVIAATLPLADLRRDLERSLSAVAYWWQEHRTALWEMEYGEEQRVDTQPPPGARL